MSWAVSRVDWTNVWPAISAIASVIAVGVAFWAIYVARSELKHNTRVLQLDVLDRIFKDIRQLDHAWIEQAFNSGMPREQRQAWCASFFNTIEYLCFLMKPESEALQWNVLHDFFDSALPAWWKQFEQYKFQGLLNDSASAFSEFKQAYSRLRGAADANDSA